MALVPATLKGFSPFFRMPNGSDLNRITQLLNSSIYTNAGSPTNGTSGTGHGVCPKGSLLIDVTNAATYQNTGSLASPTWTLFGASSGAASFTTLSASGAASFTGGVAISTLGLTITDVNVILNTVTGTKIGTATGQKLGFWNATPVIQPANANQAAVTPTVSLTGADTIDTAATLAAIQALQTLVNGLRSALVTEGLIKGAA